MELTNLEKVMDATTYQPFWKFSCTISMETMADYQYLGEELATILGTELLTQFAEIRERLYQEQDDAPWGVK